MKGKRTPKEFYGFRELGEGVEKFCFFLLIKRHSVTISIIDGI